MSDNALHCQSACLKFCETHQAINLTHSRPISRTTWPMQESPVSE